MSGKGPGFATDVPGIFVYEMIFRAQRYNFGAAAAIVMLVLVSHRHRAVPGAPVEDALTMATVTRGSPLALRAAQEEPFRADVSSTRC